MATRLLDSITMVSPLGIVHTAKWSGDSITRTKKVAIFNYPDVNGVTVQDLGITADKYPLTIYFDGPTHALKASRFSSSLLEKGKWKVTHPVYGQIDLQPLSSKFSVQPVKNIDYTVVVTDWISIVPQFAGVSFSATPALIIDLNSGLFGDLAEGGIKDITLTDPDRGSFLGFVKSFISFMREKVSKFYAITSEARSFIDDKLNALDTLIQQINTVQSTIVAAMVTIIQLPAQIIASIQDKANFFEQLSVGFDEAISVYQDNETIDTITATTYIDIQTGAIGGACMSTTTGNVLSRDNAVEVSSQILNMYNRTQIRMDLLEEQLERRLSKNSFQGELDNYDLLRNIVGRSIGYVLDENYSQKVKKTIVIDRFVATDMYSAEIYNDRSYDEAYDYFVDTNQLIGDELIQLAPGREIVVYV